VLRLKRDVGKENSLGMVATSYNFIEKHNQVLGFDGRFRLDKQTTVSFQTLGTTSRNFFFDANDGARSIAPATVSAIPLITTVSGRNWGWEVYGEGFTQDYRADVGFVQRTNSNFNLAFLRYNSDPNPKKKIISYHIHTANHVDYDWQGRMYIWESENPRRVAVAAQQLVGTWWEPGYERLFDHEFGRDSRSATVRSAVQLSISDAAVLSYGPRAMNALRASSTCRSTAVRTSAKQFQFNAQVTQRWGHFDLDFGNGEKYPRVSPSLAGVQVAAEAAECARDLGRI
jgi:hypothetical protein